MSIRISATHCDDSHSVLPTDNVNAHDDVRHVPQAKRWKRSNTCRDRRLNEASRITQSELTQVSCKRQFPPSSAGARAFRAATAVVAQDVLVQGSSAISIQRPATRRGQFVIWRVQ